MIRDGIYFHNTAELEESDSYGGTQLYRYPREVRHALGARGRFISEEATGSELRFVTEAENVRVTLLSPDQAGEVAVYRGGVVHSMYRLEAGLPKTLHLEAPPRLAAMNRDALMESGFAPEVWRVIFGRMTAVLLKLNTFGHPVRPPREDEMPRLRWLAYGSSITHGLGTYPLSYVDQTARRLRADLSNKGLSGACLCEPEAADFFATQCEWDTATLELGVNMRDKFTPEEFETRAEYVVRRLQESHPTKPIFLITVYPNVASHDDSLGGQRERRYNEILRELAVRRQNGHLHLIEGSDVLQDLSGLSCDMLHPGAYGSMLMGEQLSARMRAVLSGYGLA